MKLGSAIAACLLAAPTALAATAFETFNPLLRYKPQSHKRSSEVPPVVRRQTSTSPFLNANTTSECRCLGALVTTSRTPSLRWPLFLPYHS